MSEPYINFEGAALTKEEAAALADLRNITAWGPLKRVLETVRGAEVTDVMDAKKTHDEQQLARGRYAALCDVQKWIGDTFAETYLAKVKLDAESPPPSQES